MSNKNNAVSLRAFGYHTWEADANRVIALDAAIKFAGYQPVYDRLHEVCALQAENSTAQLSMAKDILYLESTQKSGQSVQSGQSGQSVRGQRMTRAETKAAKASKAVPIATTPEYALHPQVIAFALKELAESVERMATTISCLQTVMNGYV